MRGTYITMRVSVEVSTPPGAKGLPFVDVEVILNDTMLLSPAGHQTLASLGSVIGLPKMDVGGFKDRMAEGTKGA